MFQRIVEETVRYMLSENIKYFEKTDNSPRQSSSCWAKICLAAYGYHDFKDSSKIQKWWERNSFDFFKIVMSRISQKSGNHADQKDLNSISVAINTSQWINFMRNGGPGKRKRLPQEFNQFLCAEMQNKGIKCRLVCVFNWINKSVYANKPFWSGKYKCAKKDCLVTYKAILHLFNKELDKNVIEVTWKTDANHEKLQPKKSLRGADREKLALEISSEGVGNVWAQNVIHNYINKEKKPDNYNVMKVLKSSYKNKDRISNNLFSDCQASKDLLNEISLYDIYKGFLQEIKQDPFGLLLLSEIQLKMWQIVQEHNPVWFIDATGSVISDIQNQSKPFLFSIICYDEILKHYIPVGEFITSSHNCTCVGNYFSSVKDVLIKALLGKCKFSIPKIVVTDFSWVLINSVLYVFNDGVRINTYLSWCYDTIFKQNEHKWLKKTMNTRIYLCSTHFLKLVIKKSKELESNKRNRNAFIFAFTLLQNAISNLQFTQYLTSIYDMFCNRHLNQDVSNSITFIEEELVKRTNLSDFTLNSIESLSDLDLTNEIDTLFVEKDIVYVKNGSRLTVKDASPFTNFYDNTLKEREIYMMKHNRHADTKTLENSFYSPQLMTIICDYLPIAPLWSAIMINQCLLESCKKNVSRLTNNPVETYFGHLKNHYLKKTKKKEQIMPSQFCGRSYKRLLATYIKDYSSSNKKINDFVKEIDQEKWADKGENKSKHFSYYSSNSIINKQNFNEIELNDFQQSDFKTIFKYQGLETTKTEKHDEKLVAKPESSINMPQKDTFFNQLSIVKGINTSLELSFEFYNSFSGRPFNIIKSLNLQNEEIMRKNLENIRNFTISSYNSKYNIDTAFMPVIQKHENLRHNFVPLKTKANGNCLYNSVSLLLFGKEDNSFVLRLLSVYVLLKHEKHFRNLLDTTASKISFEQFVMDTAENHKWANEYNEFLLSLVNNRPIYTYGLNSKDLDHCYNATKNIKESSAIALGYHKKHFVPLIPKDNSIKPPMPSWHQFKHYRLDE